MSLTCFGAPAVFTATLQSKIDVWENKVTFLFFQHKQNIQFWDHISYKFQILVCVFCILLLTCTHNMWNILVIDYKVGLS